MQSTGTEDSETRLGAALADRYHLVRPVGQGGAATVYLARDLKHDRDVAIKVLRPEVIAGGYEPERFLREIRIAAGLSHPLILPLYDSDYRDGFTYYVMPFVPGSTLRGRLREGPLPFDDALVIAGCVAQALDYAHERGFIHRDIKPENVLLHGSQAVVADFGVARAMSALAHDHITGPGLVVGTPAYMSPEQAAGDETVDGRSDIYSLGCVVYEMLSGEPPFRGPSARATIAQHITQTPPPLRVLVRRLPAAVDAVMSRVLAKAPADRFPTAQAFVRALAASAGPPSRAGAAPLARRSVAVLPFQNLSADPENEYLSDGLTDELINALTKVEGLRVPSRSAVFALKGRSENAGAVGARLGAEAVLDGSVRRAGSRLRVTVQLSSATDGTVLWSEQYDRELLDVFSIQEEIARVIVRTLRARWLEPLEDPVPVRYQANPKAYQLYLKGRYYWNLRTQADILTAIECFEQAIVLDPRYAPAYAGLADAYALQLDYRGVPVTDGMRRAREEAERALALDETLAEGHASLGWVAFVHDWNWRVAREHFERAIELNPRYPTAHQRYACLLVATEQFADGLAHVRTAVELDPASPSIRRVAGWMSYYCRQPDEAAVEVERALALNPVSEESHRLLGLIRMFQGSYEAATVAFREAISISDENAYALAGLGHLEVLTGNRAAAEEIRATLEARGRERYVSPVALATVLIALECRDEAFASLHAAAQERRGFMAYLRVHPLVDGLRRDPRFPELLRRVGL